MFGAVGIGVSVLAVALYGVLRGHWLDALLGGIALGMSMLPEEFPVVLAVFMAMGAWRISRARVLTRRAAAIETLGSATVLCTDKTGTLTENRMTIMELRRTDGQALRPGRSTEWLRGAFVDVVRVGILGQRSPTIRPHGHSLPRTWP
jgi:P-type Ca2+ transporter type 2C